MPTVLVTGCSSGFGLETAKLFHDRGWKVVATMRQPKVGLFPASDRLHILPLDVTDADSIAACVMAAGPVDALVNNAGVGLLNALEGVSIAQVREVFETNAIGTIAMTQAVLPNMRERRTGVIVNVTSTVTLGPLPLLSVYTASKAAVNAFTESIALELEPFGVRARLVLPGRAPTTAFGTNARARMGMTVPDPYQALAQQVFAGMQTSDEAFTTGDDVAEAVWRSVTDPACPMRLPAGADATGLAAVT